MQALGVEAERVYVDDGLTGTHRDRPGLRQALAACRAGDTLVVTKLDRLARSLPDARAIADELSCREVKLALGTSVHDPTDPVGTAAVQRAGHGRRVRGRPDSARTREGMRVAKAKGRLRGKQPKLSPTQEAHLVKLYRAGEHTISELEELFAVTRSTVYRAVRRAERRGVAAPAPRRTAFRAHSGVRPARRRADPGAAFSSGSLAARRRLADALG